MIKRIFASVILGIILFTGENAMAETALNAGVVNLNGIEHTKE